MVLRQSAVPSLSNLSAVLDTTNHYLLLIHLRPGKRRKNCTDPSCGEITTQRVADVIQDVEDAEDYRISLETWPVFSRHSAGYAESCSHITMRVDQLAQNQTQKQVCIFLSTIYWCLFRSQLHNSHRAPHCWAEQLLIRLLQGTHPIRDVENSSHWLS